jgi:LysM repeat protein
MFVRVTGLVLVILVCWVVLARPSVGSGPQRTYVVKPYDTLWSIASSLYGGDPREGVWKLRQRNHLSADVIRAGQKLVVP